MVKGSKTDFYSGKEKQRGTTKWEKTNGNILCMETKKQQNMMTSKNPKISSWDTSWLTTKPLPSKESSV
jgi:hypothetical protein